MAGANSNTFQHDIVVDNGARLRAVHLAPLDLGTRAYVKTARATYVLVDNPLLVANGTSVIAASAQAQVGRAATVVWALEGPAAGGNLETARYQTADVPVTSSVVPVATDLNFPIQGFQVLVLTYTLFTTFVQAGGIRFEIMAPPGTTGIITFNLIEAPGGANSGTVAFGTPLTFAPALTQATVEIVATLLNGATDGTVALTFAQDVSDVGTSTLKAFSSAESVATLN